MAGLRLAVFYGKAPKISPELLPDTAAQIATNCKLFSGDLIPYPEPVVVGNTGRSENIKTLYALRDPVNGQKQWLSWENEVDIAVATGIEESNQRFYYTGDDKPRVTDYILATTGAPPYPVAYYDLGLPLPDTVLTTTAAPFTPATTQSYKRDSSGIVTIKTAAPHGLRSGTFVTISGFTFLGGTYEQKTITAEGEISGTYVIAPRPTPLGGTRGPVFGTISTTADHGLTTGDVIGLRFSDHPEFNKAYTVTVTSTDQFTITVVRNVGPELTGSINTITNSGTYDQKASSGTMNIRIDDHGLQTGTIVSLGFSNHTAFDGAYSASVVDKDTFAINVNPPGARSGDVIWTNAGTSLLVVTIKDHGLTVGAQINLEVTSGTAASGSYTVRDVLDDDTFEVDAAKPEATSGDIRLDIRNLNARNAEITRVTDDEFTLINPGPEFSLTTSSDGTIDIGGRTQARSYLYTWFTPWDEESIGSEPSDELFIKEGVTVTVSNLPNQPPPGDNFIRGIRLYRLLATPTGAEYFRLRTLWFPVTVASVQRTANVSRVRLVDPHNIGINDRFKISGITGAGSSFNITGGIVTDLIDDYTFEYAQTASNVAETAVSDGLFFHDVSENPPTTTAVYWGDSNFNFVDNFDSRKLRFILQTDNYEAPPKNLRGLTAIQNNILCGFVGNTLYFSEPGRPHAWPSEYIVTLEHNIVGIVAISGSAFVGTDAFPYLISGSDPANNMSASRIDANFPCLSKRSLVTMGYGVVYSTHDGLAVYSPEEGPSIITKLLYNNDTWRQDIDPATVVAEFYGDNYFASHSSIIVPVEWGDDPVEWDSSIVSWTADSAFVFEQDPKVGGFFVDLTTSFLASWYDSVEGAVFYVRDDTGDIFEWNDTSQDSLFFEWKSKVFILPTPVNLSAARIVADYGSSGEVEFKLFANKSLIMTKKVTSGKMFRLPMGYRSDTFEVSVESNVRIRAIYLSETALGLRQLPAGAGAEQ